MKKISLIITLVYTSFSALAVETYITFNPKNCLNCASGIYRVCVENKIKIIELIIREEYRNDTVELNELYEFNRFPKLKVKFSDSLYTALSTLEYDAELIILDKQKELYRRNIKKLIVDERFLSYYSAPQQLDSICNPFMQKSAGIEIGNHFIVLYGNYTDNTVINRVDNNAQAIKLTDNTIIDLYKLLYKDSFNKRYPIIKEMIAKTPTYKPTIEDIREWDKDNMMLLGNIKDYKYNKEGDTVFMFNRPHVMKYKFSTREITGIYSQDASIPSAFDLWYTYISDGKYYGQGLNISSNSFMLLEYSINEITKTFSFKRDTKVTQPAAYRNRKVSSMEEYNILIKGKLLCFVYDDKITLLNSGKQVSIPFADYANSMWNAYEIRDLHEDKDYYYILYIHGKEFRVMRLKKDSIAANDILVGYTTSVDSRKLKFYDAGNKIIFQPNGKNCLYIKQVEF